jgi:hypothetical protein
MFYSGQEHINQVVGRNLGPTNPHLDRRGDLRQTFRLRPHPNARNPVLEGADWTGGSGTDFADPFIL